MEYILLLFIISNNTEINKYNIAHLIFLMIVMVDYILIFLISNNNEITNETTIIITQSLHI